MLVLIQFVIGFQMENEVEDEETAREQHEGLKTADVVRSLQINVIHRAENAENCAKRAVEEKIKILDAKFGKFRRKLIIFASFENF